MFVEREVGWMYQKHDFSGFDRGAHAWRTLKFVIVQASHFDPSQGKIVLMLMLMFLL
jgi:hypothetical protein